MSLSTWIMDLAVVVAPPARKDWARAMGGEFAAVDGRGAGLSWALGSLAVASGWRLRADAFYLLALLVAWRFWGAIVFATMDLILAVRPAVTGTDTLNAMVMGSDVPLALLTFALCLHRPRWIAFTALLTPALIMGLPMSMHAASLVENGYWAALPGFLFEQTLPALAAAALAWAVVLVRRRLVGGEEQPA